MVQSFTDKGKQSRSDKGRDPIKDSQGVHASSHCEGCNRGGHTREECRYRAHPDFNTRRLWVGSAADLALRRWQKNENDIRLTWGKRADGTTLPRIEPIAVVPAAQPRQDATDDRDQLQRRDYDRRGRDSDRRDQGGRGGRGGRGQVQWDKDKGTPCLTSIITHLELISTATIANASCPCVTPPLISLH